MNLSKILTAVSGKDLVHLEDNTSLNPNRDAIVYKVLSTGKIKVITEALFIFKMIDWAFSRGYMLTLFKDTDGSFEEEDYTCALFVPRELDVDFVSNNFFDSTIKAIEDIIEMEEE